MNALDACRAAHRAWLATQPQFVIPGVLEEVDADAMLTATAAGVRLLEPTSDSVALATPLPPCGGRRGGLATPPN